TPGAIVRHALAATLLLYSHPYAVFLVSSQWLLIVLGRLFGALDGRVVRRWLAAQAVVLMAIAPWAIVLLSRDRLVPGYPLPPFGVGMLKETLLEYANDSRALSYMLAALVLVALLVDARALVSARWRLGSTPPSLARSKALTPPW